MLSLFDIYKEESEKVMKLVSESDMKSSCRKIVDVRMFSLVVPELIDRQNSVIGEYQTKWSKLLGDVELNRGRLKEIIQASFNIYGGTHVEYNQLNTDSEIKKDCVMIWTTQNKIQMGLLGNLFRETLRDYRILVLNSSNKSTNRLAQRKVKKEIRLAKQDNKKLVIISSTMGSRSFSVSQIDSVFLWFDGGQISTTIQKIARGLTTGKDWYGEEKTHGDIVSFSFDQNRTENTPIDEYIIKQANKVGTPDFTESVQRVLNSIQLFTTNENGLLIELSEDDLNSYSHRLINETTLKSVAKSLVNPSVVDGDELGNVTLDKSSKDLADGVDLSNVKSKTPKPKKPSTPSEIKEEKIKEKKRIAVLLRIVDNSTILTEINNIDNDDIIDTCDSILKKGLDSEVVYEFGVSIKLIKQWILDGGLPLKILNTITHQYNLIMRPKISSSDEYTVLDFSKLNVKNN